VVGTYTPKPATPTVGSTFRDTLKDGSSGPDMVVIPAGSFRMGDIQGGGESDEQSMHSVSVEQFAMGQHRRGHALGWPQRLESCGPQLLRGHPGLQAISLLPFLNFFI